MNWVVIGVFWLLAATFFFGPPRRLFYFFFAVLPLASFATLPPQFTAGLTFTPGPIVALLILARVLLIPGAPAWMLSAALMPRRLLLLSLFLLTAFVTTAFMPQIFAREIDVVPFRGILQDTAPLVPSIQNVSQLFYLTISVLAVFAFSFLLRSPALREHALRAVVVGAGVTVLTGLLDFLTQYLPIKPLLAPLRTASYSLALNVEILGGKRVVGLTPEASTYGGFCLAFLATLLFFRFAIRDQRWREIYAPSMIIALIVMIWLAKSTGAYIGLTVALGLAGVHWLLRASRPRSRAISARGLTFEFWVVFAGAMGMVLILLLQPALLDPIYALIDRMVLTKGESGSYEERGFWRMVAWQSFLDSNMLGVGVGSTRASSAFVSTFSSVGLFGAVCYYAFLIQCVLRRAAPGDDEGAAIVGAFAWAILPALVVRLFVGSVNFGVFYAFLYGLVTAVGVSYAAQRQRPGGRVRFPREGTPPSSEPVAMGPMPAGVPRDAA